MIRMNKTLVTGATGLVGNNVVRLLLARGEAVRVLQRDQSDPRPLAGLDVEIARGDVRDAAAVAQACQGVERIVHAAGYVHIGWTGAETHRAINVEGTRNVVAGAIAAGARLVHVSSVDTLGYGTKQKPADEETAPSDKMRIPYPLTKIAGERLVLDACQRGQLNGVIVNPVYMFGPWDWKPSSGRMLLEVARNKGLFAPPGGNDICDVRDVAAGILAAAERGAVGRKYILGGEPMSYLQAWRMLARLTGGVPTLVKVDPITITIAGWCGDLIGRVTGRERDLNSAAIEITRKPHHFTCQRAVAELGYSPRPASEAMLAAYEWFCEHGYLTPRKSGADR